MAKPHPGANLVSMGAATYWTGLKAAQIRKAAEQKIISLERRGNSDFMDYEDACNLYRMRESISKL